jgi:hypothetical protein
MNSLKKQNIGNAIIEDALVNNLGKLNAIGEVIPN